MRIGADNVAAEGWVGDVEPIDRFGNEVGLRNVLQRLIGIARENAGAQVARLLLLEDGVCRLEADSDGDTVTVSVLLQGLQSIQITITGGVAQLGIDGNNMPKFPDSVTSVGNRSAADCSAAPSPCSVSTGGYMP